MKSQKFLQCLTFVCPCLEARLGYRLPPPASQIFLKLQKHHEEDYVSIPHNYHNYRELFGLQFGGLPSSSYHNWHQLVRSRISCLLSWTYSAWDRTLRRRRCVDYSENFPAHTEDAAKSHVLERWNTFCCQPVAHKRTQTLMIYFMPPPSFCQMSGQPRSTSGIYL